MKEIIDQEKIQRGKKVAEELGLEHMRTEWTGNHPYGWAVSYNGDAIHKLLAKSHWYAFAEDKALGWRLDCPPTHKALLIAIRPLEQESKERKLLRELMRKCEQLKFEPGSFTRLDLSDIYERARALLEKKD